MFSLQQTGSLYLSWVILSLAPAARSINNVPLCNGSVKKRQRKKELVVTFDHTLILDTKFYSLHEHGYIGFKITNNYSGPVREKSACIISSSQWILLIQYHFTNNNTLTIYNDTSHTPLYGTGDFIRRWCILKYLVCLWCIHWRLLSGPGS